MNCLDLTTPEPTDGMPTSLGQTSSIQEPLCDPYRYNCHQADMVVDNRTPSQTEKTWCDRKSDARGTITRRETVSPIIGQTQHVVNSVNKYGNKPFNWCQLKLAKPLCRSNSIEQLLDKYAPLPPPRRSSHHSQLLAKLSSNKRDKESTPIAGNREVCRKTVRFSIDDDEPPACRRQQSSRDVDGHDVRGRDDEDDDDEDDDDDEGFEAKESDSWSDVSTGIGRREWSAAPEGSCGGNPSYGSGRSAGHRPLCRLSQRRIELLMPRSPTSSIVDQLDLLGFADVSGKRQRRRYSSSDNGDSSIDGDVEPARFYQLLPRKAKTDISWQSSSADSAVEDLQANISLLKHVSQVPSVVVSDHSQYEQRDVVSVGRIDDQNMLYTTVEHKLSTSSLTSDYSDSGQSFTSDTSLSLDDDEISSSTKDKSVSVLFFL